MTPAELVVRDLRAVLRTEGATGYARPGEGSRVLVPVHLLHAILAVLEPNTDHA